MPSPRIIPSIEILRQRDDVAALEVEFGRTAVTGALREAAATLRAAFISNPPDADEWPSTPEGAAGHVVRHAARLVAGAYRPGLRPVINATGVVVHTNLGRAPLARAALERVALVGAGYANLEYDLDEGRRGRRDVHAESIIRTLTGAEAAVVVNNNAAATMLMLAALARGREVVISRGELVEIGGGFRVPEIMAQSGAVLREVGTTNRTRVGDYAAAIGDRTGLILRVHPSNFRMEGFTERPDPRELVDLGHRFQIPVVEDLGSGNLLGATLAPGVVEPTVRESVEAGYDVVCFSGDKLLGGPQAGLVVGTRARIDVIRRHPLMRAMRVDKMTYAALEATLIEYAAGRARETVPVWRMLAMTADDVGQRAAAMADVLNTLDGVRAWVIDGQSTVGGGSAPGSTLATELLAIGAEAASADALEARLRRLPTPVIARIENDRLVLDLRTVLPEQDEVLVELLVEALAAG